MIAPDQFMINGKAWIEATFGILDMLIAKVGVEALAVIAVWQNVRGKIHLKERLEQQSERLDRQGARIDQVALAVPATETPNAEHRTSNIEPRAEATTI